MSGTVHQGKLHPITSAHSIPFDYFTTWWHHEGRKAEVEGDPPGFTLRVFVQSCSGKRRGQGSNCIKKIASSSSPQGRHDTHKKKAPRISMSPVITAHVQPSILPSRTQGCFATVHMSKNAHIHVEHQTGLTLSTRHYFVIVYSIKNPSLLKTTYRTTRLSLSLLYKNTRPKRRHAALGMNRPYTLYPIPNQQPNHPEDEVQCIPNQPRSSENETYHTITHRQTL